MRKFIELTEAKGMVVFTFGRFNPPTTGHEKLIQKVASVAGSNPYRIYPSQSQNQKKDPLPFALKIAYMRKMFPRYAKSIRADKNSRTAIEIAVKLHDEGFTDLVMVVGSDRVKEFSSLLNTYNGVEGKRHGFYKFNTIDVVSAGERDPDAEGVSGMSASKMRAAASLGDFESFEKGLPSGFRDGKKLYLDVRKYMGIREEKDMGEMTDFETLRDLYLTGKIWNIDDLVEANGVEGKIIRRGTNYVAFNDSGGKVHKAWLHEITLNELPSSFITKLIGKIDRATHPKGYEKIVKRYVDAMKQDKNTGRAMQTAISGISNAPSLRSLQTYINKLVAKGTLPKELKAELELDERRTKQDPDIKKSKGTEPAKYYAKDAKGKDMAKSTKQARDRHFTKGAKMDDDNPAAYKPAPGDYGKKTKPSKYTKKFKQMYGEQRAKQAVSGSKVQKLVTAHGLKFKGKVYKEIDMELVKINNSTQMVTFNIIHPKELFGNETNISFKALRRGPFMATDTSKINVKTEEKDMELNEKIAGLVKKSEKSGIAYGILKTVYDRGMAAWRTGHRPGTTPQQWAFARVNSFLTGGGARKSDADQWKKAKKSKASKKEELETESLWKNIQKKRARIKRGSGERMRKPGEKGAPTRAQMKRAQEQVQEWFESEYTRNKYKENYGHDWWWKLDEVHDLMLDKLGVECIDCMGEKQNTNESEVREKAEYDGRPVKLNNPTRGDVKKYKVYVRNDKGNVVKVEYGDPNMEIKRDDPERRKNFRARHNCDNPGPKYKARYWSCKFWSSRKSVTDLMKG